MQVLSEALEETSVLWDSTNDVFISSINGPRIFSWPMFFYILMSKQAPKSSESCYRRNSAYYYGIVNCSQFMNFLSSSDRICRLKLLHIRYISNVNGFIFRVVVSKVIKFAAKTRTVWNKNWVPWDSRSTLQPSYSKPILFSALLNLYPKLVWWIV